ncbi:beta-lactamase-like protein [Phialemonium atrogriseum]|uniref:Beta-lactamase-like protein n=1 Tax=Phialemonium atrogriseum TaxID=1093897 RepID=A0AAJ0CAA2_9PEZI|nr:beta-lactamase-like protein [Phialemonium atrogriseum]KAK1772855.1 beta-lactamase-like protein [Phialemonium atrogriseum]
MSANDHIHLDPAQRKPHLKDQPTTSSAPASLPLGKQHSHPRGSTGDEDAIVFFIGNATTVLEWNGVRILTDPNFLHAGDHVHLGPGVSGKRLKSPAVDLHELPPLDCILLSHYHEDHFDRMVEGSLSRDFPIITTPHAKKCLTSDRNEDDPFTSVRALDFFQSVMLYVDGTDSGSSDGKAAKTPVIKVTATPGKHVPPGLLSMANDLLHAVPPTNGYLLELGYSPSPPPARPTAAPELSPDGYRIYISGDTLFVDELREIPERLGRGRIDLMLVHLGGTTIPSPSAPLVMVTMDAEQGLKLMRLMDPDVTVPIHFDDYDLFLSPLSDFKAGVSEEGWDGRVVYLDRGEQYRFKVRE